MKLGIMQPYFFPYIGYFQLINTVDKYIIYDNLNFIRHGWVNRNQILVNHSHKSMITVPLKHKSSFVKIRDIEIDETNSWRKKLLKTLELNYKKAPMFNNVYPFLNKLINFETTLLSEFNINAIKELCKYLRINTIIESDSMKYKHIENNLCDNNYNRLNNKTIDSKIVRVLKICKEENADTFYNPIGGVELYPKELFAENKIDIYFIKTKQIYYKQFKNEFIPNLSIIDVMMFNSVEEINNMLDNYELI